MIVRDRAVAIRQRRKKKILFKAALLRMSANYAHGKPMGKGSIENQTAKMNSDPLLWTYCLNTDRVDPIRPATIPQREIDEAKSLIPYGGAIPGSEAFTVSVDSGYGLASLEIRSRTGLIIISALVWDPALDAAAWNKVEGTYLDLSDKWPGLPGEGKAPNKPDRLPWLATIVFPLFAKETPESFLRAAAFQYVLSLAILQERASSVTE